METVKYLNTLINLITQQPETGNILDNHGLGPETTFGQIGIDDYSEFTRLYSLLNHNKKVTTTPIKEIENGLGHDFTMTTPITIHFFHWK